MPADRMVRHDAARARRHPGQNAGGTGQGGGPEVAGGIATSVLRGIYPRRARGSAGVTRMRKEQPLDQQHEPSTGHVHDK